MQKCAPKEWSFYCPDAKNAVENTCTVTETRFEVQGDHRMMIKLTTLHFSKLT